MQSLEQRRERPDPGSRRERLERLRLTAQWQTRPHSRLTDTELTRAIRHAERQQAEHHAAADRPASNSPSGNPRWPPATVRASPSSTPSCIGCASTRNARARWRRSSAAGNALRAQAGDAAERAAHKEFDAERTRWWQPGRREQLQAEAAADKALSERVARPGRRAGPPRRRTSAATRRPRRVATGPRRSWSAPKPATSRTGNAPTQADQHELARLRDRIASQDTAALDAGTRRDELLAEQQLRATMPEPQATLEHQLRTQAIQQQQLDQATPVLHSDLLDHSERTGPDRVSWAWSTDLHRSTSTAAWTQAGPSLWSIVHRCSVRPRRCTPAGCTGIRRVIAVVRAKCYCGR